jgi:nicotinate phosphoribosyltransferase
MSYVSLADLKTTTVASKIDPSQQVEFVSLVLEKRGLLGYGDSNEGELAAFIAYAQAFPGGFLALVDTYDTLHSGLKNFLSVGLALHDLGYRPIGIRLDSGDLAYLSKCARDLFRRVDRDQLNGAELFGKCNIVASNDVNEDVLLSLNREGHEIDTFGIGTHLVTCQKQPALGCVYKLVEVNGQPRIKLSQEVEKLVIPGRKTVYRLYGSDSHPLLDLMLNAGEEPPLVGQRILVRHPFAENKRAHITPTQVKPLLHLAFDGESGGVVGSIATLAAARQHCSAEIRLMRNDHVRSLNPTPYKVSVSQHLYEFMHTLWMNEAPIADLS